MHIRRPLATVLATLALFGGGAAITACGDPAGLDRNDGSTSDDSGNTGGAENDLPNNSDRATEQELDDDLTDPD